MVQTLFSDFVQCEIPLYYVMEEIFSAYFKTEWLFIFMLWSNHSFQCLTLLNFRRLKSELSTAIFDGHFAFTGMVPSCCYHIKALLILSLGKSLLTLVDLTIRNSDVQVKSDKIYPENRTIYLEES